MLQQTQRWRKQPPPSQQVNPAALNSQGLNALLYFPFNDGEGGPRELIQRGRATNNGGIWAPASVEGDTLRNGYAQKFSGVSQSASLLLDLSKYQKITVAWEMYWDAFANDDKLAFEFTPDAGTNNGFFCDPNGGVPSSGLFQLAVGPAGNNVGFTRPSAAVWHSYVWSMDRTQGSSINVHAGVWVDTIPQSLSQTHIVDVGAATTFANSTLFLMSRNNASLFGNGRLRNFSMWTGLANQKFVNAYYDDPHLLFSRAQPRKYLNSGAVTPPATGGSSTIFAAGAILGDVQKLQGSVMRSG